MNETKNNSIPRTADGEPLVERGTADSALDTMTEPDEEDDSEPTADEDEGAQSDDV